MSQTVSSQPAQAGDDLPAGFLDGLSEWVRLESPTHEAAAVSRMMDLVAAVAGEASISSERIAGTQGLGDSVILRAGPVTDVPGILVLSHLDTVHPVGTIENGLPLQ